ncbi:MAG: glycosyltransferase [Pseudomonadota bacterium]|nr:glycosyltransferase [Pseudomonadota bacterium]
MVGLYFYDLSRAGGAERMLLKIAGSMASNFGRPVVFDHVNPDRNMFFELPEEVVTFDLFSGYGLFGKFKRYFKFWREIKRRKIKFMIGFMVSGDIGFFAACKLAGVKIIACERNSPAVYEHRFGRVTRMKCMFLLRLADRVVVQFQDYLAAYPQLDAKAKSVIGNPVTAPGKPRPLPLTEPKAVYQLLALGRLDNFQKRFDILIEAFCLARVSCPNWRLVICGDGPDKKMLTELVSAKGMVDHVDFRGTVRDTTDLFDESDLFAIPSSWEGFPNALAEAMAHGLPAVGFQGCDGVSHLITNDKDGWLADGNRNAVSFSLALIEAMSDASERHRRGGNASAILSKYSEEKQLSKWIRLIDDVASGAQ